MATAAANGAIWMTSVPLIPSGTSAAVTTSGPSAYPRLPPKEKTPMSAFTLPVEMRRAQRAPSGWYAADPALVTTTAANVAA